MFFPAPLIETQLYFLLLTSRLILYSCASTTIFGAAKLSTSPQALLPPTCRLIFWSLVLKYLFTHHTHFSLLMETFQKLLLSRERDQLTPQSFRIEGPCPLASLILGCRQVETLGYFWPLAFSHTVFPGRLLLRLVTYSQCKPPFKIFPSDSSILF